MEDKRSKKTPIAKPLAILEPRNGVFLFPTAHAQQEYLKNLKGPNFPACGALARTLRAGTKR